MVEAELLAQIVADPGAIEPRRVHADLLIARGDRRGELGSSCAVSTLTGCRALWPAPSDDVAGLTSSPLARHLRVLVHA